MYKSPFFQHETGQNRHRKQYQMSTQSKSICLELKQPLLRYLQVLQNWNHWVLCRSSSGFNPLAKTDGRSFHLIQFPNLPSATSHASSQPLCTESTSREGPGMLSHHSLTVRSQPWCCFKAFRPCRPCDCILTCRILLLFLPGNSCLPLRLHPSGFENTKWWPLWIMHPEEGLALWAGQFECWATSTDFWTSPNVSLCYFIYFCSRLRSVLIFSRFFLMHP